VFAIQFTFTSLKNTRVIFFIPFPLKDVMLLKFQAKQLFWRLKQKVMRKSLAIYYA
jgi:hypothetical protein